MLEGNFLLFENIKKNIFKILHILKIIKNKFQTIKICAISMLSILLN